MRTLGRATAAVLGVTLAQHGCADIHRRPDPPIDSSESDPRFTCPDGPARLLECPSTGRRLPQEWVGLWRARDESTGYPWSYDSIYVTPCAVIARWGEGLVEAWSISALPDCLGAVPDSLVVELPAVELDDATVAYGGCDDAVQLRRAADGSLTIGSGDWSPPYRFERVPVTAATELELGLLRCERGGIAGTPRWQAAPAQW